MSLDPNEMISGLVQSEEGLDDSEEVVEGQITKPEESRSNVVTDQPILHFDEESPQQVQPAEEVKAGEEGTPEEEIERLKRESAGRLNEISGLRRAMREQSGSIEELRQILLAREESEGPTEEEVFGEEIVDDPAVQLLVSRMDALQEQLEERDAYEQERIEQQHSSENVDRLIGWVNQSEQMFTAQEPSYPAAYEFIKEKRRSFYASQGYAPEEVDNFIGQEEYAVAERAAQSGRDPARTVFEMAKSFGFDPVQHNGAQTQVSQTPVSPVSLHDRVNRMRHGVDQNALANTANSAIRSGELTQAQFLALPKAERMKILGNQAKFERLARTGRISVD
jgi:hypothetical protein